jgi:gamma-glutamyltranspeptidase / glutathione hydrolase
MDAPTPIGSLSAHLGDGNDPAQPDLLTAFGGYVRSMGPTTPTVIAPNGIVAAADQLATAAGLVVLARGGNAVDAAIATNAVMAVVGPHLCGLGGDLFALVHVPGEDPVALNSTGRAGSGASAEQLRSEGHRVMPFRGDVRTVTVPGCVDGWVALHERFGTVPLPELLAPAIGYARHGYPASPLQAASVQAWTDAPAELVPTRPGALVRRVGVATALEAVASGGREAFYGGAFGEGLLALGDGWFAPEDLASSQAEWVTPLQVDAWGARLWTMPPNSQGYLTLAAAWIAEGLGLPEDPDDPQWAHLLVEAAIQAGHDRPSVLHDRADGAALVSPAHLSPRRAAIDPQRATRVSVPSSDGDTTYLCTADRSGMSVSLIQSNASGFGSWVVEPSTGINLHNRGIGFSLEAGHPAELAPGRRPPHTLSPAMLTARDGSSIGPVGTMGGDSQPQILLQLVARVLQLGERPGRAMSAPRWSLAGTDRGFDTWTCEEGPTVILEPDAMARWADGLAARGHRVVQRPWTDSGFGHAQLIVRTNDGCWAGAADPRAIVGACAGC